MKEKFSRIVLDEMRKKTITVKQLAKETGLSVSYLYELLRRNSKKRWNDESIEIVSKFLNISIEFKVNS